MSLFLICKALCLIVLQRRQTMHMLPVPAYAERIANTPDYSDDCVASKNFLIRPYVENNDFLIP